MSLLSRLRASTFLTLFLRFLRDFTVLALSTCGVFYLLNYDDTRLTLGLRVLVTLDVSRRTLVDLVWLGVSLVTLIVRLRRGTTTRENTMLVVPVLLVGLITVELDDTVTLERLEV